jgi:23S rRNA (uridine2552-2'-O)-methyltransferase
MNKLYQRKDQYYTLAKKEGYRSRAAYKLLELNKRFHLLKKGISVIELGAAPGGWLQVIAQKVIAGEKGRVIGVDLVPIEAASDIKNITVITGDVFDEETFQKISEIMHGEQFDLILSDMSPKLTGIKELDNAASSACGEAAFHLALKLIKNNGNFVIKLFKSNDSEVLYRQIKANTVRGSFEKIHRVELDSTRKTSNEIYLVGLNFKEHTSNL